MGLRQWWERKRRKRPEPSFVTAKPKISYDTISYKGREARLDPYTPRYVDEDDTPIIPTMDFGGFDSSSPTDTTPDTSPSDGFVSGGGDSGGGGASGDW